MDGKAVRKLRRAVRVEQAIKYLERRREKALLRALTQAVREQANGGLTEVDQWQTLPETVLLALWRYRGRWPTRLEMAEMLDAIQRYARVATGEVVGTLPAFDSERQVAVVGALATQFVLDELSFDGPVYTTFCGRMILTPLSRDGAFADLRFGERAELG